MWADTKWHRILSCFPSKPMRQIGGLVKEKKNENVFIWLLFWNLACLCCSCPRFISALIFGGLRGWWAVGDSVWTSAPLRRWRGLEVGEGERRFQLNLEWGGGEKRGQEIWGSSRTSLTSFHGCLIPLTSDSSAAPLLPLPSTSPPFVQNDRWKRSTNRRRAIRTSRKASAAAQTERSASRARGGFLRLQSGSSRDSKEKKCKTSFQKVWNVFGLIQWLGWHCGILVSTTKGCRFESRHGLCRVLFRFSRFSSWSLQSNSGRKATCFNAWPNVSQLRLK